MLEVKALLGEKLQLPPGYFVTYSGEDEHQQEAVEFLSEAFLIGLLLILMILITQFNSVLRPAIIMGSVVMSLIGVLLGLLLFREKFGIIMTGMGVISLAGVVVNNAIVLIDYTDQLLTKHGLPLREALLRAGVTRFRPVLLTAITTILGMLPMALGISIDFTTFSIDTGSSTVEWWGPLARAVSFGLSFATVLTLIPIFGMIISSIPAILLESVGGECSVTLSAPAGRLAQAVAEWPQWLMTPALAGAPRQRPSRPETLAEQAWIARVNAALRDIVAGRVDKIVLARSRKIEADAPFSAASIARL